MPRIWLLRPSRSLVPAIASFSNLSVFSCSKVTQAISESMRSCVVACQMCLFKSAVGFAFFQEHGAGARPDVQRGRPSPCAAVSDCADAQSEERGFFEDSLGFGAEDNTPAACQLLLLTCHFLRMPSPSPEEFSTVARFLHPLPAT